MRMVKVGSFWLDPGRVEAVYETYVRVDYHNEPRAGVRMASGGVFMVAEGHDTDTVVRILWPETGPYR